MRLAIITISAFGEAKYVDEAEWEGHIVYWYNNADLGEIPIVVSDGLVYEAGIYCMNIGILGDEYDWVITLTKPDSDEETDLMPVYKRVNGTWVKQTAYQRQNGEWVLISFAEQSESVSHTVRFLNWDGTLLETVIVETDGGMAVYTGETPTKPNTNAQEDWEFIGWNPEPTNVTGDMDCVAQFKNKVSMARLLLQRTLAGAYANNRVTKVGQYVFYGCSKLTSLDFANVTSIEANAFNGCSGLETLILRSSKVCTLSATNAFTSTKITSGTGYIYVPSALLANYQSATNWSTYASKFRAIEDYPEICGGE